MNEFHGSSPWKAIIKDVLRKRRDPIVAAVSYVGVNAPEVLPLRSGDFLVCDASERSIKQGVTSAKALASYRRLGVQVFSHEGLHSKVVASEKFAWVGSANASSNSRDNLTEASVRIEGPACRETFYWALSLATEDAKLSAQDIRALARLPVSWQAKGGEPGRVSEPMSWPNDLSCLVILELDFGGSAAAEKAAEKQRIEVKKILSIQSSQLNWFENKKPLPIKEGEWFIPVYGNKVGKPCRLEKVKKEHSFDICWYAQIRTPARLRATDLRSFAGVLEEGFNYIKVKDKRLISKIGVAYGIQD
jgi:hypothetical protein